MIQKRINYQIKSPVILLINEHGNNLGNILTREAINKAKETGLDLVEVGNKKGIPVCKIINYGKWKYDKTKKIKKNTITTQKQMKEIKLRPNISLNDLRYRSKHVDKFLKDGFKVKLLVRFKGREQEHMFITGKNLLDKFFSMITETYLLFDKAKIEGNSISVILNPGEK